MIDKAGAAEAATETVVHAQTADARSEDVAPGQPAASAGRSKETARASVDRAFAALEQPAAEAATTERRETISEQNQAPGAEEQAAQAENNTADPPSRFSPDAKAAWGDVPESVRA